MAATYADADFIWCPFKKEKAGCAVALMSDSAAGGYGDWLHSRWRWIAA
jgi:hypothetical protein